MSPHKHQYQHLVIAETCHLAIPTLGHRLKVRDVGEGNSINFLNEHHHLVLGRVCHPANINTWSLCPVHGQRGKICHPAKSKPCHCVLFMGKEGEICHPAKSTSSPVHWEKRENLSPC